MLRWSGTKVAALAVSLTACGDGHHVPGVTVADSAGIEIVTDTRSFTELPVRSVPGEPVQQILDEALYQVTVVQPLLDGRVAVGVDGAGAVLVFRDGERVSELGRSGEGPGEFRNIQSLVHLPGDSLAVYDPRQHRLTVFPLGGGDPRVLSLGDVAPEDGWSRIHALEGSLVLVGEGGLGGGGESGIYRNTSPSVRIAFSGEMLATYGEFPGLEAVAANGMVGRAPFGALLATATVRGQLVVGTAERPELLVYGPDGRLDRIIRWVDEDRAVTQKRMDQFVEFQLSLVPEEQASFLRGRLASMPFAPEHPAHTKVLSAPDGSLWVGEYAGPEAEIPPGRRLAPLRWLVFGADGALTERIETPVGFVPMALEEGLVWGVYYDELGVESVLAYHTER